MNCGRHSPLLQVVMREVGFSFGNRFLFSVRDSFVSFVKGKKLKMRDEHWFSYELLVSV